MEINERSYGGKLFRPAPVVQSSNDERVLFIVTPWGDPKIAEDFIEMALNHINSAQDDPDKTVVYSQSENLNREENQMQEAILATHSEMNKKYNDDELRAGVEILCLLKSNHKVTWFQVGAPFLSIVRGEKLIPICHPIDLSFDYSQQHTLPPLPKSLIGVQQQVPISIGTLRLHTNDQLLLIARSYVPYELFKIEPSTMNLDTISHALANDNAELPFWAALVQL